MADLSPPGNAREGVFLKGIRGSLVLRIITITSILVIIPLLCFSIFSYFQDYKEKLKDNFLFLDLLGAEKIQNIQQELHACLTHMDLMETLILTHFRKVIPDAKANELLVTLMNETEFFKVFFLQKRGDQFFCSASSDASLVGKDCSFMIRQSKPLLRNYGLYVDLAAKESDLFYLIKPVTINGAVAGALITTLPAAPLLGKLTFGENLRFPAIISITQDNGTVVITTNNAYQNKVFLTPGSPSVPNAIELTPIEDEQFGYTFTFQDQNRYALFRDIENIDFSLVIDVPEHINFISFEMLILKAIVLFSLIILLGGGATIYFSYRLSSPLKQLCKVMDRVGHGDFKAEYIHDKMGFEINMVGDLFNRMVTSLVNYIDEVKNERVAKETFEKELKIGQTVQQSLLPKQRLVFPGLDIAAGFIAAKEVGGDFYDFIIKEQPSKKLMIAIADTSDKGVFACFYSLSVRSMLRSFTYITDDLKKMVQLTNNLFCEDAGESGAFVTAWVAFYDEKTRILEYTSCGHFPGYLKKGDGTLHKLTTAGVALGIVPFETVVTATTQLDPGDTLLLFTDGVIETLNSKQEMFGEKHLLEIYQSSKTATALELVQEIQQKTSFFAGNMPQYDDFTLVILKVTS